MRQTMDFLLRDWLCVASLLARPRFADHSEETFASVLDTCERIAREKFADEARSMYYGESELRPVWGEVTPEVAKDLLDEGVPAMPLPKPFAPEPPRRKARMN